MWRLLRHLMLVPLQWLVVRSCLVGAEGASRGELQLGDERRLLRRRFKLWRLGQVMLLPW